MDTPTNATNQAPDMGASPSWLDRILAWSLSHRVLVLLLSGILLGWGSYRLAQMPVDVLPDLTAPTVTILTDAPGLTPVEVEKLVTIPLESALHGATGVRRIRSAVVAGFSVVWVEFGWNTDLYRARQIVNEKIQLAASQFPNQAHPPVLAPITSIMGEIMFVAVRSDKHSSRKVRSLVDRQIRRRLLSVAGVAQVLPIGGQVKQYQVLLSPTRLKAYGLTQSQVVEVIRDANTNRWGGMLVRGGREYSIAGLGRIQHLSQLKSLVIKQHQGVPVTLSNLGVVRVGNTFRRGTASYNGKPAVVLGIQKQPKANTLALTRRLDRTLDALQRSLPAGVRIERKGFRQSRFIEVALSNVQRAMIEGALLVIVVLMLFLLNARATFVSLMAIPLSVITAFLLLELLGATVNTMTLGGITVAIGALVDDAVIDVENIFRRLRDNAQLPPEQQQATLQVVFAASKEIRTSILFATLILMLVFVPLFFLSGVEGRLLHPLGWAYLIAIFGSLVVALTVTPVLSYYLLARRPDSVAPRESFLVRGLNRVYRPTLLWCLRHPRIVVVLSGALLLAALAMLPFLGRSFLPPFNEGSLTVSVTTLPGTSLRQSSRLGQRVEKALLTFPEVVATTRRTGRGELDEHIQGVYASEVDVVLQRKDRAMPALLKAIRNELGKLPGVLINIGQPISHRIDHMLSGTRAAIAIKVYGPDLQTLKRWGETIRDTITPLPGLVDVEVEPIVQVPRYQIHLRPHKAQRYGLNAGQVMRQVESGLRGTVATQVLEGQKPVGILVRYQRPPLTDVQQLRTLPIATSDGAFVPLHHVATVRYGWGPNRISREQGQRRIIISANTSQSDLIGAVRAIQQRIQTLKLPPGYHVTYGGQFEREATARWTLTVLSGVVLVGIVILLLTAFGQLRSALLVLLNLPLALIGGVFLLFFTGQVVSIASLVGWITLFGIATRNGIILVSHYQALQFEQGYRMADAVLQGSLERLNPVLMTALTTGLAMLPLMIASGKPGNELQSPMAFVIFGGLFTSTLLNMLLLPVLYRSYGPRPPHDPTPDSAEEAGE